MQSITVPMQCVGTATNALADGRGQSVGVLELKGTNEKPLSGTVKLNNTDEALEFGAMYEVTIKRVK